MPLPKCTRISCRPMYTEHPYRGCDKHSIWCATSGCYRNAVGATLDEATGEWMRLVQHAPQRQDGQQDGDQPQLHGDLGPSCIVS
jgi:hypothetical protein